MADHERVGGETLAEVSRWITEWSQRLSVDCITLSGGEPLSNPDLPHMIRAVRASWPDARIRVVTNGQYLNDNDILPALFEVGNALYEITCHRHMGSGFEELRSSFIKVMSSHGTWENVPPTELNVHLIMQQGSVEVRMNTAPEFMRPYNGALQLMRPWHSKSAEESFSLCPTQRNPILYKNRLFKCGPIANLRDTLTLHKLETNAEWWDYLKYKGYGIDDNIAEFVADYGNPNRKICTMCSQVKDRAVVDHYGPGNIGEKALLKPIIRVTPI